MQRSLFEYHPVLGYRFIPRLKARVPHEGGGYLVQVNGSGFRCRHEVAREKPPGTTRILLFGDSHTAGDGVSNGKRFGDFLEELLPGNVEVLRCAGRRTAREPRRADTQTTMNLKIKFRESFRPFAPSCLVEDVSEYFDFEGESPYMLLVAPVREERRRVIPEDEQQGEVDNMLEIINQVRSDIPAVTHVDCSARIQTVDERDHPHYYQLIKQFKALTGYGVVVNSSFNVRGEPLACTPQEAYLCFMRTEMDLLVLEDHLVWKAKTGDSNINSTSREDKERLAWEFYIQRLLPVSRGAADGGIRYFERGPDPALETYFIRQSRTRWTAADFAAQSPGTPERLADALSAFWTQSGNPELAALAPDFAALAAQVYDVDAETAGVTPFMYVMF